MTDRLTSWFPLLLLAALAGLTFWLDRAVQPPAPPRDGSGRHDPDYIIENFSATKMAADGRPRHRLSAKKMLHFPDNDSTRLDAPHFVQVDPGRPQLTITSRLAQVSSNGEQVQFIDEVKAVRGAYRDRTEMVVTTSFLEVIPEQDIARTDKAVTIVDANTKITAVGLELNNKTRTLKLLSQVQGNYAKPKGR